MSASLVGSEMCIRDSHVGTRPHHRQSCQQNSRASARPTRMRHLGHPVSYTHLTLPTICSV
eukprot:14792205-Alexandrium_andersonii.AAC.1